MPLPDDAPDVAETGGTFEENALLKARAAAAASGLTAVADDSGLRVDALNGMPGVLSARWAGRRADDAANLELVLDQLTDVPDGRRGAAFVCAAAVATPDGEERVVVGEVRGALIREPRGSGGFGYDPIFVPHGDTRTTARDVRRREGRDQSPGSGVPRAGGPPAGGARFLGRVRQVPGSAGQLRRCLRGVLQLRAVHATAGTGGGAMTGAGTVGPPKMGTGRPGR